MWCLRNAMGKENFNFCHEQMDVSEMKMDRRQLVSLESLLQISLKSLRRKKMAKRFHLEKSMKENIQEDI